MPNHVLLNNLEHRDVRILTSYSAALGNNQMFSLTFVDELRSIQAHYPILFKRDTAGQYLPVALHGLQEHENLFLTEHGWDADYIPLSVQRQPFLIGFQSTGGIASGASNDKSPVIHLDMDSPRVSLTDGEPIFLPQGGNSPFINQIATVLQQIQLGVERNSQWSRYLTEYDLMEAVSLDLQLSPQHTQQLSGFYAIHEEKLAQLSAAQLGNLQQQALLQPIYMALASLSQLRALIARKTAQLGFGITG